MWASWLVVFCVGALCLAAVAVAVWAGVRTAARAGAAWARFAWHGTQASAGLRELDGDEEAQALLEPLRRHSAERPPR